MAPQIFFFFFNKSFIIFITIKNLLRYSLQNRNWPSQALVCSFAPNLEAMESSHLSNHKLHPKNDVKAINRAYVKHLNAWKSLSSNPMSIVEDSIRH